MVLLGIVLFIIYLAVLGVLIVTFIKTSHRKVIVIKGTVDLINWIFSIVFWPITLIVSLIMGDYKKI